MKVLELFKGTGSIGNVVKNLDENNEVISLDIESRYRPTICCDIMTWDYKQYSRGYFDLVTASPVCLFWSKLRNSWIGRKLKSHGDTIITREILQEDIDTIGKPMVDKTIEIIEYFKPKCWWIENPRSGKMKHYITEKYPEYDTYFDFDYCKYSTYGYKKSTRFWTNIEGLEPLTCKNDCENMSETNKKHKITLGHIGGGGNRELRYRIPSKLIEYLLEKAEI